MLYTSVMPECGAGVAFRNGPHIQLRLVAKKTLACFGLNFVLKPSESKSAIVSGMSKWAHMERPGSPIKNIFAKRNIVPSKSNSFNL